MRPVVYQQAALEHDLIDLGQESFAVCFLALAGEFEVGSVHLAHGRLGAGGEDVFHHG